MPWILLFSLLPILWPAATAVPPNTPRGVPVEIVGVWLRFHETELCQDLDAKFVFHEKGLEVWCVVEDEKAFEKLTTLLDPLRPAFQVDVYPTRLPEGRKTASDRDPPPSLWNNSELRGHMQSSQDTVMPAPVGRESDPEYFLKLRILLFAEQTLEYEKRMGRYGADLPALAYAGLDPGISPELKARAAAAAAQHAQELDKYARRLGENMLQALPKAPGKSRAGSAAAEPRGAGPPVMDTALQLARLVQNTGRRIVRFLNPQLHTVGLADLREPSLLESIREVRSKSSEFRERIRASTSR